MLAPRHTFGIKADVKDNICYLDEQTVLYPSGNNIIIFNTEQKTQKFIAGTENTEGITAMAVSPNHKYVAVAERAKEGEKAQVTIYDLHTLKRRKVGAMPPEPTRPCPCPCPCPSLLSSLALFVALVLAAALASCRRGDRCTTRRFPALTPRILASL